LVKIFRLYKNEMVKLFKKLSFWIMLAIIPVVVFGSMGLNIFAMAMVNNSFVSSSSDWKSELQMQIDHMKGMAGENKDGESNPSPDVLLQVEQYQYQLSNDISPQHWKAVVLSQITGLKIQKAMEADVLSAEQLTVIDEEITKLSDIITQDDWKKYIALSNEMIEKSTDFTKEQKEVSLEINKMRLDYNIAPREVYYYGYGAQEEDDPDAWKASTLSALETNMFALVEFKTTGILGTDEYGRPRTEQSILENIAINKHHITTNNSPNSEDSFLGAFVNNSYGNMSTVLLLVVIIAGTIVSQEFSRGTIKLLAVTPNKRWKIFTAKLLCVVSAAVGFMLILIALSFVAGLIQGGTKDFSKVALFYKNGQVIEVSVVLLVLRNFLFALVEVLTYAIVAMTLSTLTRNTALSVALGIFLYFASSIVTSIIITMTSFSGMGGSGAAYAGLFRYLLFLNTNWVGHTKTLSYGLGSMGEMVTGMASNFADITFLFSICTVITYVVVMLIASYDSFNRRDIKN